MNLSSNTNDILLFKIQEYFPSFTVSLSLTSLLIHTIIAIISYTLYIFIIAFLIKNRKNSIFNSFFYYSIILNGFCDISFHIDNFFTSNLLLYEPYLNKFAPTEPSFWFSPLFYIGYFFVDFLFYNSFIISINRVVVIISPIKAKNIFETNIKLLTAFGLLLSGLPHLYLLTRPAYFSVESSKYTNDKKIGKFIILMWKGHETMPINIVAIYCGIFTVATFLVNLFIIYLLIKKRNKKNKNYDTKMTIYVILHFISQITYISILYTGYFVDMNLEDQTIIYILKIVRPWCFNILCLFAPYSLIAFNTNIRKMIYEKITFLFIQRLVTIFKNLHSCINIF
ncbi:7TM GPCR, serpentine receptor class v (Srv) family-containing protein [Strongyloides ratti]|uniref:7TM GPCR, serpentine receptor class v (Srv) family-containing protein n=1 Tax=Strongyloides ratti TaxID=34506 RepID=A0A090LPM0_STRRB|nr:7TM GPCR, serpentine receptor class v (Srv) family-containing protein [Strongyloides ratti]CEF69495.1 7TM GPCR, serpentine receptor class v (Srv) family-containing protein [Strongyloides ratti]